MEKEGLRRPLESRTDTHWEDCIEKITIIHEHGGEKIEQTTPSFHWILRGNGRSSWLVGGDVIVIPENGCIVFQDRRMDPAWYKTPEQVLLALSEYGWGEPPNFDEVCASLYKFPELTEEGKPREEVLEIIINSWKEIKKIKDERERFATAEELNDYLNTNSHLALFLENVKGLSRVEIGQDNKGAFVLLHIKEEPEDQREISIAALAENIAWPSGNLTVHARVKFNFIKV